MKTTEWTWTSTENGYRASDGRASLERNGKAWILVLADGRRSDLGCRASFTTAERRLSEMAQ